MKLVMGPWIKLVVSFERHANYADVTDFKERLETNKLLCLCNTKCFALDRMYVRLIYPGLALMVVTNKFTYMWHETRALVFWIRQLTNSPSPQKFYWKKCIDVSNTYLQNVT